MSIELTLEDNIIALDGGFADVQQISDGGYERGYAAGVASVPDYASQIVNGTITEYISDGVTKVKLHVFRGCEKLHRVSLPNCIAIEDAGFQNCGLTDVYMPKLETVGNTAFGWCSLEQITLYSVKTMAARAFYYCTKLKTLIIRQSELVVPLGNTDAFNGTPIKSGTGYIYVPKNLVDSYKTAANWSTYANQIRAIEDYPEITGG